MDKAALRQRLLAARRALTTEDRTLRGERIRTSLLGTQVWTSARTLGCYLSLADEVSTWPLLASAWEQGKRVAVPVLLSKDLGLEFRELRDDTGLRPGPLGILQPVSGRLVPPAELDLVLVPGVGFDLNRHRLGFGGGYFDRFLSGYTGWSLGLAFEVQVVDRLPVSTHDRAVDQVQTEDRTWSASYPPYPALG